MPIFLARAGMDEMPGLNAALSRNLPIGFVNHSSGPHAFDLLDDSVASRGAVRGVLVFLAQCLVAPGAGGATIQA